MAADSGRLHSESQRTPACAGVCVVTHPLSSAGENATRTLLEILGTITTVSLVTADLPADSTIRERHETIELSDKPAEQNNIVVAAFRFLLNQIRMGMVLTKRDETIVLFFGATAYLGPIIWAKLLGRTVVLEPRGNVPLTLSLTWEQQLPSPLARFLAGSVWALERIGYWIADGIITYTPSMADELDLARFHGKLHPTGARYVDADTFAPRTPFEERERVVGFLGRFDEEKGIKALAVAVQKLPDEITVRFIGDGDLRPWLAEQLREEIAQNRVELQGWVNHEDVPAELNRLRLLVLPSQPTEGLPTTILESLACGTPVYATPVSGVPDVVRDGKTGFVMLDQKPARIARDIQQILGRDDLDRISTNGRKLIEQEYTYERAVDRYRRILDSLNP